MLRRPGISPRLPFGGQAVPLRRMLSFFISHDMAVVKPRFSLRVIFRAKIPVEIHLPPLFLLDRTAVRSYSNSSPFRHTKALPLGELDAKRPERASLRQKNRCTATGTSLCSCRNIAVPSLPSLHPRPLRLLCRHLSRRERLSREGQAARNTKAMTEGVL